MNCPRKHRSWQGKSFYWEGVPEQRAVREGKPGELLCHVTLSLGFHGDGISFWVVFGQSFSLRVLPGGACIAWPRWMPARRILGGDQTHGVSFWSFPNSSGWWWLISSVFLTRTSCCKTTHADGYYGAWSGWAVSVSVLSLTEPSLYPKENVHLMVHDPFSELLSLVSLRIFASVFTGDIDM